MKNNNAHQVYVNAMKKGLKVDHRIIENESGKQVAVTVKIQLNVFKVLFVKCYQNGRMVAYGYKRNRITRQKGGKWVTVGYTKYGKRCYEKSFKNLDELYAEFPCLK